MELPAARTRRLRGALRRLVYLIALTATLFTGPWAVGQDVLEEVTVTAQKREQTLQEIPFSVSAVTGEELQAAGIENVFDLAFKVPSLEITQNAGPINTSFRIRRIGNEANIPNFEPAVGLFVDGAFRNRSGVGIGGLFDLERIEVLRGPQSTLYGKNTTAGVINIITRKPTDQFDAYGELTVGLIDGANSAGLGQFAGAVGGPLSDGLNGRLSMSWTQHDHVFKNLTTGGGSLDLKRYSFRGQLMWDDSDRWDVRLIASTFRIDNSNTGESEFDTGVIPTIINAGFGVPCPVNDPDDRQICFNRSLLSDLDSSGLALLANVYFDDLTLSSVTSFDEYEMFRDLDADQLNIDVLDFFDRQDSNSYSQEFRLLSSADNDLTWLAGLYWFSNDFRRGDPSLSTFVTGDESPFLELAPGIPFGQPGYTGYLDSSTDTDHYSAFGQVTWRSVNFEFSAAARWLHEEKQSVISNSADHPEPSVITLVLSPSSANARLQRETEDWTWSLSAQYFPEEASMLYLTASRGFKSGGFNAGFGNTPVADREFRDEIARHLEIGAKTTLFDRRLQLNLAAFNTEYDDYQAASFISLQFLVNNAENVTVRGFEADGVALLSGNWMANFALSYVDAEYDEYDAGSCFPARTPDDPALGTCVLSGQTLPFAPKWKTALGLMYERPVNASEFYSRLDWSWTSDYNANTNLDPRHVHNSFSVVNLRGGFRFGNYDISAWVNNATDETFVRQDAISNLFDTDPAFQRYLGLPRSYGVTLRVQF